MSSTSKHSTQTPGSSGGQKPLRSITTVVFDLDGVVYRGKTIIKGAKQTVAWLRKSDIKVFFLTNNSTLTRQDYVKRLSDYGIPVDIHEIYSSAYATALYLQKNGESDRRVLVVGEGGLATELRNVGLQVFRRLQGRKVDYVVVGMDRKITYAKLTDASAAISDGAKFIATNRDPVYPVEHGFIPGGGTIVAAIETATAQKPLLIGKPSPFILKALLRKERIKPQAAILVGDRLDTDVICGRRAGVWTIAVLTGVTADHEISCARAHLKPHWVIESIADLPQLIESGGN